MERTHHWYGFIFWRAREYWDHGHELKPAFDAASGTRTISGVNFENDRVQGAMGLVHSGRWIPLSPATGKQN